MAGEARRIWRALEASGVSPLALAIPLGMCAANMIVILLAGFSAKLADFALVAAIGGLFAGVATLYAAYRPSPVLAGLVGTLAILFLNASFSGLQAMLGLAAGFPLVDAQLGAIDTFLGFDHRAIVGWTAAHPSVATGLGMFYRLSVPLTLTTGLFLAATGQAERLRVYLLVYALSLAVTSLVSMLTPAIGSYGHFGLAELAGTVLPEGSGIYHLKEFHWLRAADDLRIGPLDIAGIVTFPSFHCCMALLIAHGLWGTVWLRGAGLAYAAGTLVATVPIGGHYVIDLVGGAVIFGLSLAGAGLGRPMAASRPVLHPAE